MKRFAFSIVTLLCLLSVSAQTTDTERSWIDDFDAFSEVEDFDNENWQDIYETLEHLHQNPININEATQEELQQIPFLTDKQIEDILAFIYRYGKLKSTNELIMIESLGFEARRLLLNFITLGDATATSKLKLDNLLKYGKHEVSFTARVPL